MANFNNVLGTLAKGSKKLSLAEKLGLPKGTRNNLNRFLKEALEDLEMYINSGSNRQIPNITKLGVTWSDKAAATSSVQQAIDLGGVPRGEMFFKIPLENGILISYNPAKKAFGVSGRKLFPTDFGEATLTSAGNTGNIILTAPYVDALTGYGAEDLAKETFNHLPKEIDSKIMKEFWKSVFLTRKPGTYTSGDMGELPLGDLLIKDYLSRLNPKTVTLTNGSEQIKKAVGIQGYNDLLNHLLKKTKWSGRANGLSTDSYMALLKQGNREGYALRFSPDGMSHFNPSGIKHAEMNELLKLVQTGKISKKEFIKKFNEWVKPYNGMEAKIVNGEIVMPHPYIYKKKFGGILNYFLYAK